MAIVIEPYGRIRWRIRASYFSPKLRYAGKKTPGLRWIPEIKSWVGHADAVDACARLLRDELKLRVDGDVPEPTDDPILIYPISVADMFPYQIEGTEFLVAYAREGALLADQQGLGKSMQTIRAARALRARTIVVCPAMVRQVWKDEAEKWWPDAKVGFLDGVKGASEEAFEKASRGVDILVVHYEIVHAWSDFIMGWAQLMVLDEAHYLVSDKARRSRAIRQIADVTPWRFALTGTPMMSRPKDLWNLLDILYAGRFGKFFSFSLRYCDAHQFEVESKKGSAASTKVFWSFDGASNLPELKRRLQFMMLRRTKKQVASQLPPMTRQILDVDVPKSKIVAPHLAFRSETALRRALTLAADGKLPQVTNLVLDHARAGDHKIIVWCWRRAIAEFIANEVHREFPALRVAVVHGGHSHSERRKRIDKVPDVLCATMDSIGVGINLIEYDTEVFAELSWLPSTLSQCEARPHRHGQKRPVLVQYVIARGTCDEWIKMGVINKLDLGEKLGLDAGDKMLEDLRSADEESRNAGLHDLYLRVLNASQDS